MPSFTAVAVSQVGYVEGGGPDGHSGNDTKYWADLYPPFQGSPWCATFVQWCMKHSSSPILPVPNPYYCPSYVTYAKAHGLWDTSGKYDPGDLTLWDWSGLGVAEHIEIVLQDNGSLITEVGGNTSSGVNGSQNNGGGVYLRTRAHGPQLLGVVKYSKVGMGLVAPPAPRKLNPFPAPVGVFSQGATGAMVRYIQWAVGVPVDGIWGPQTTYAVLSFQAHHQLKVDGIVGPMTEAVLKTVVH